MFSFPDSPTLFSYAAYTWPVSDTTQYCWKSTAAVVVADDGVIAKAKVAGQRATAKPKPEPETVIEISQDTEGWW
ncbi:hypothetical protein AAC387_Pa10g0496 [Persea americana]